MLEKRDYGTETTESLIMKRDGFPKWLKWYHRRRAPFLPRPTALLLHFVPSFSKLKRKNLLKNAPGFFHPLSPLFSFFFCFVKWLEGGRASITKWTFTIKAGDNVLKVERTWHFSLFSLPTAKYVEKLASRPAAQENFPTSVMSEFEGVERHSSPSITKCTLLGHFQPY